MFVDPRRLLEPTPASKEEGVPPYIPELPLSYEATLNYNQSVYRIREIHCEPSGLENTSLLVAYGLGMLTSVYHLYYVIKLLEQLRLNGSYMLTDIVGPRYLLWIYIKLQLHMPIC